MTTKVKLEERLEELRKEIVKQQSRRNWSFKRVRALSDERVSISRQLRELV